MSLPESDRASSARTEKLDAYRKLWDGFARQDWDAMFAQASGDFVVRTDPDWPDGGEYRGRASAEPFLKGFLEPFSEIVFEPLSEAEWVGDRLVERGRWIGSGRSTEITTTLEFTVVASFTEADHPLVSRIDAFFDHEEALAHSRAG